MRHGAPRLDRVRGRFRDRLSEPKYHTAETSTSGSYSVSHTPCRHCCLTAQCLPNWTTPVVGNPEVGNEIVTNFRVAHHPPAIRGLPTELTLHQADLGSPGVFEGFT
jgi:hypothetical protein